MPNKEPSPEGKLVGEVVHYYGNINVAVIGLSETLKKGDEIRIIGGVDTDFTQKVKSMEVDHKKVETAKKKDQIGLKTDKKVREGYKVYRV